MNDWLRVLCGMLILAQAGVNDALEHSAHGDFDQALRDVQRAHSALVEAEAVLEGCDFGV